MFRGKLFSFKGLFKSKVEAGESVMGIKGESADLKNSAIFFCQKWESIFGPFLKCQKMNFCTVKNIQKC